jgi:hypothetical protein
VNLTHFRDGGNNHLISHLFYIQRNTLAVLTSPQAREEKTSITIKPYYSAVEVLWNREVLDFRIGKCWANEDNKAPNNLFLPAGNSTPFQNYVGEIFMLSFITC